LKESIKLSINNASINVNPIKKDDDSARKSKLTLCNSFKPQLIESKDSKQDISEFKPYHIPNMPTVPKTSSQSVMIEESFMSAKLKNIYKEMSPSEDLYNPSTNIASYSNLNG
jgi:hypothetical protein